MGTLSRGNNVHRGRPALGTAVAGVVGCRRDRVPSCVDKWHEQGEREESALLWPPSVTAAGEPHSLPTERTSLTVAER